MHFYNASSNAHMNQMTVSRIIAYTNNNQMIKINWKENKMKQLTETSSLV